MQSIGQKFLGLVLMAASASAVAQAPQTPKGKVSIVPLKQDGVPIITASDISGSAASGKGIYFNVASGSGDDGPIMANLDNQTVHLILNMPNGAEPKSCVDLDRATIIWRLMPHSNGPDTAFRLIAPVTSPTMNMDDETVKTIYKMGCIVADVSQGKLLLPVAWHHDTSEVSPDPRDAVIADHVNMYRSPTDRDRHTVIFTLSKVDAAKVEAATREGRPMRVALFQPDSRQMPPVCYSIPATIVEVGSSPDGMVFRLVGPEGPGQMFVPITEMYDESGSRCVDVQTHPLPPPPEAGLFHVIRLPNIHQLSQPQK